MQQLNESTSLEFWRKAASKGEANERDGVSSPGGGGATKGIVGSGAGLLAEAFQGCGAR